MESPDRGAAVSLIADYFVGLSAFEANHLLTAAYADGRVPSEWNRFSEKGQRAAVIATLQNQRSFVIARMAEMCANQGAESSQPASVLPSARASAPPIVDESGPVFVVHGHAEAARHEVVRVLERATGREVIVLREQANSGRTIVEKFEDHAAAASYAVVLLTADDEGGAVTTSERRPRGRQNVIFELGFFFGLLGRGRVAVLIDPGVEEPSDINGLVYIALDSEGAWKQGLARELASVGIDINYARIP